MRHPSIYVIAVVLAVGAFAQVEQTVIGRYTYDTNPTRNSYLRPRSDVTGEVVALDLGARQVTVRPTTVQIVGQQPEDLPESIRLADDCRLFVDNRPQTVDALKVGDSIQAWVRRDSADSNAVKTATSLYLLNGAAVGTDWYPRILLRPDTTGCLFFDDFETGDFRKWQYQVGCVSVLTNGALRGTCAFTATRRMQTTGGAHDHLFLYGLPQMDDIWLRWKFLHTGEPADSQEYAIVRPFPGSGAQLFAVRIVPPSRVGAGQWRLACQLAMAPAVTGQINLEPNRVHDLILHWRRGSAADVADGTVETWVDGQKDLDLVGSLCTWTPHKLARLSMGVLHTGMREFGATVVVDDFWIGDRKPADVEPGKALAEARAEEI